MQMFFYNKNYQSKFDKNLKERFFNTYRFSNHDKDKFFYPNEYMNDWEKNQWNIITEKEDFYSHSNMGDITDADHAHAKRACKNFEIKTLGEYHDLYVQSKTLLLADAFENLRNICLKTYRLDSGKFLSDPGLAWQAVLTLFRMGRKKSPTSLQPYQIFLCNFFKCKN